MIVQDAVTGGDVRHRFRWSYDRLAVAFLVLLAVLPAVLAALYVRAFGVNVPMWDQWYLVPMIEKFYRGRLSLGDFFDQFYEHRLFFPRVAMLVVVALARWNVLVEMYFDLVLMAISVAVIYLMYVRYHPPSISSLAIFLPVPWLFFSFRQWDNLLWGWQIQWYMAITFFLISMYFLDSARRVGLRFVLAAVSASIASLSLAAGLMTWPVGLVHLYLNRQIRADYSKSSWLRMTAVWMVVGVAVFALYFFDYQTPQRESYSSLQAALAQPLSMVQFVLLGLGGTLAFERANALGVGLLLAACYAAAGILLLRARLRDQLLSAMPVSLMLFSLLYLGQLVIGRSGLGPEKALESKYSTVTTLGLIGLYLLVTSGVARRTNLRTVTSGVLLGVVVVGLVTTGQNGLDEGIDNANVRRKNAYYLSTYGYQTDENLFRLGVDSDMVKRHARVLEQYRLSVFSEPRLDVKGLRRLAGPDTFYLDSVNGREAPETAGVRIDPGRESTIVMLGWAVDGMAGRAAGGVVVDLDGRLQIPALYGLERTDVVRDLGSAAYRYSGFRAEFATALLKRGPHRLTVMIVSADKAGYYLGDRSVTVDVL